jgi:uncharacterized protein
MAVNQAPRQLPATGCWKPATERTSPEKKEEKRRRKEEEKIKMHKCWLKGGICKMSNNEIYIFGSLVNGDFSDRSDIDIAVKGLKKKKFFKTLGKLLMALEHPVDLVNLEKRDKFSVMLERSGGLVRVSWRNSKTNRRHFFLTFQKLTKCCLTSILFQNEVKNMEVIREIKRVYRNQLTVDIPDEFLDKELEIIVFPLKEKNEKKKPNRVDSFFDFVNTYHFKLPENFKFDREELYDR